VIAETVRRVVDRAAAAGADAEALGVSMQRHELVARNGSIELSGELDDERVHLRLTRNGRTAHATAPASADPRSLVDHALALLPYLPESEPLEPPRPRVDEAREAAWMPVRDTVDAARAATLLAPRDREVEVRMVQEHQTVVYANNACETAAYENGTASVRVRVTVRGPTGEPGHAEREETGLALAELVTRLDPVLLASARERARLLAAAQPAALPELVVLEAPVAAGLVAIALESFGADAVAERRSRLSGRLGERVAGARVTLVDDPLMAGAPLAAPFDDEGVPTRRRALVHHGIVAGYLTDRRFAGAVEGSMPGCGWRRGGASPPRPRAANVLLEVEAEPVAPDAALRIVESYGTHTANPTTGAFSIGAEGVVERRGERVGVGHLTVAGNVFDLLRQLEPGGGEAVWIGAGGRTRIRAADVVCPGVVVGT
jgi:PmbA protein